MTRVKRGTVARKRRNKILELNRGYRGSHSTLFRTTSVLTMGIYILKMKLHAMFMKIKSH